MHLFWKLENSLGEFLGFVELPQLVIIKVSHLNFSLFKTDRFFDEFEYHKFLYGGS